jgi:branched-chain amino acid transport system substrate-binding protein
MMNINSDLVYLSGSVDQVGPFIRKARAAGYTGAFLGLDASPALVDLAGPLLIENGGMYYTSTSAPVNYYPDAAKFVEVFDNSYGTLPQSYAVQAYDATGICLKAIEEASKSNSGELPTRNEVAIAIRGLVDYKGITGIFNFNKNGDPTLIDYFAFKVASVDTSKWDQNPLVAVFKVEPPK